MARGARTRAVKGSVLAPFDPWSNPLCTCPFKYSLNPYTGCSIGCLYCYATAYVGNRPSTPKKDLLKRLARDLARIPPGSIVNVGTSSDPYPPVEAELGLTRRALALLLDGGMRVLVTTKSDLVVRDADLMRGRSAAVTPTITMLDERMARLVEPLAPSPSRRIEAVRRLTSQGIPVGVRVDPVIPYVNDDPAELEELVCRVAEAGARMVVTSTYKARPDNLARMRAGLGEVGERIYRLYKGSGVKVHGYLYLPRQAREALLKPVIEAARRCGLEYATCREGLTGREWFNAGSCDGSHLIPPPPRARGGPALDRWMDSQSGVGGS
ncbi:SPL family radical SAM protein [Stetteria hydrogenophila]